MTKAKGEQGVQAPKPQGDQDAVYIRMELGRADTAESHAVSYHLKSLDHFRNAGKRLTKKRDECKEKGHPYHRKWLQWLKDNDIDQQRDSECRRLHEGWDKLPPGVVSG
jgi:hypothetical protein